MAKNVGKSKGSSLDQNESVSKSVVEVIARYKGDSKKGTFHVYDIKAGDPNHGNTFGIVGGIYIPKGMDVPKRVIVQLGGNISDM